MAPSTSAAQGNDSQSVRRSTRAKVPKTQPQALPTIPRRPRKSRVKLEETEVSLLGLAPPSNSSQASTMSIASAPPALERSRDRPSLWLDTSIAVIDLTRDSPLTSLSTPGSEVASPLSPLPASYFMAAPALLGQTSITAPPGPIAGPSKARPLTRREAARQGGDVEFAEFVKEKRARRPNRPKSEGAATMPPVAPERKTKRGKRRGGFSVKPYIRTKVKAEAQEPVIPVALEEQGAQVVETGDIAMGDPPVEPSNDVSVAIKGEPQEAILSNAQRPNLAPAPSKSSLPSLPMEVKVLIDSFISGYPVSIIASREQVLELIPEDAKRFLCKEFVLGYLGFFSIIGLEVRIDATSCLYTPVLTRRPQEIQVFGSADDSKVQHPTFQWKFRVEWMKGGDQCVRPTEGGWPGPWWRFSPELPNPTVPKQEDGAVIGHPPGLSDIAPSPIATPPLYLLAQEAHPNYPLLGLIRQQTSFSSVPNALKVDLKFCQSDEAFPTGWLCASCGKINFQLEMRHRQCTGSVCLKYNQKVSQPCLTSSSTTLTIPAAQSTSTVYCPPTG